MLFEENQTVFDNSTPSTLNKVKHSNVYMYYACMVVIMIPGFLANIVAIVFIVKDIRKAVIPAIVLLLVLCVSDLAAIIFTATHLSIIQYVTHVTYALCAPLSVLNTFFRLYSGVVNVMMSADRALAICAPYYYKRNIRASTWKLGCLVSALCIAMFGLCPVIGLGDVVKYRYVNGKAILSCSTLHYREEPIKKICGVLYGAFGLLIIVFIVTGNCMVIRAVWKMRTKVASVNLESSFTTGSDTSKTASVTPFEIAFANLMGGLAIVYLISGGPYSVSIQFIYSANHESL